jgi:tetraacyldisaccharide 4'-kinase
MHAPAFWARDGWLPHVLAPFSVITRIATARRVARPGWRAPVPVICCGNVTVGGAGKTTLVLDLAQRLAAQGRRVHVLLRGYGGSVRGTRRVTPGDDPAVVGDEGLLLADVAPVWVGGDRGASGREAVAAGADVLLMDDGLQNPSLSKDLSLLVIDGLSGFGNGRLLPAGPLREPVKAGAARCAAAVLIGDDRCGAVAQLPAGLPVLRADLVQTPEVAALRGRRVLAFAGIAVPEKFFAGLEREGVELAGRRPFPDHHPFTAGEIAALLDEARKLGAVPVTTPKDAARLPGRDLAIRVVGVRLRWHDEAALARILEHVLGN